MLLEDGQELRQKDIRAIIDKNTANQLGIKYYIRNIVPLKLYSTKPRFKCYYLDFMISFDLICGYTPKISADVYWNKIIYTNNYCIFYIIIEQLIILTSPGLSALNNSRVKRRINGCWPFMIHLSFDLQTRRFPVNSDTNMAVARNAEIKAKLMP